MADRSSLASRVLAVLAPLILAGLDLTHPTWADGTVYTAVAAQPQEWVGLHALLLGFSVAVAWGLRSVSARDGKLFGALAGLLLGFFAVSTVAFLAIDGLAIGFIAQAASRMDPASQRAVGDALEQVWSGSGVRLLANFSGFFWAASLLCCAAALYPGGRSRFALVGLALVLGLLAASAISAQLWFAADGARLVAVFVGAAVVYRAGAPSIPFALLAFAAVLPQHVGPEAALGMLCVFAALTGRETIWRPVAT